MRWLLLVALVGCTPSKSTATKTGCDFAGRYRLLYEAGVGQKLWFRFELDKAGRGKLIQPLTVGLADKPLKVDLDPASCKLDVIAESKNVDVIAALTLNRKTDAVTGTLRILNQREGVKIAGVRDKGVLPSPQACIKPGVYELVVPAEQEWTPIPKDRSCETASLRIPFLVEFVGDELIIDQLEDDGDAAWAAEDIAETAPCQAASRFRRFESMVTFRLGFAGEQVSAEALDVNVRMGEIDDRWRCIAVQPMAWVERRGDSLAAK